MISEYIPFKTSKEVVENIRGRMVKTNNKKNIYYFISYGGNYGIKNNTFNNI